MLFLSATSTLHNFFQLLFVFVMFVVVIFLCYFTTRWIGSYQKTKLGGKNFKIIESMKIGNNKFLALIEIGEGEYYCIALGKDEVTLIGKVDADKLKLTDDNTSSAGTGKWNFNDMLQNFRSSFNKK